ncbi:MAG: hypothetical protein K0U93_06340, partial [Gammaproteobacteria bacterium]|nr:hypothetical protein [Gammaproteobacteria bacterium]
MAKPAQAGYSMTRVVPFAALHLSVFAVWWVGVSTVAISFALIAYAARMFFITGFYHRYFSHRAFKASRVVQFAMAVLGCSAGQ